MQQQALAPRCRTSAGSHDVSVVSHFSLPTIGRRDEWTQSHRRRDDERRRVQQGFAMYCDYHTIIALYVTSHGLSSSLHHFRGLFFFFFFVVLTQPI